MHRRIASGIIGICSTVAATVVGMTWDNIPFSIAMPILAACGTGILVAAFLRFWPNHQGQDSRQDLIGSGNTQTGGPNYVITNTGLGLAIGHAESVNLTTEFELTDELLADVADELDASRPVCLFWVATGKTPAMAAQLEAFLRARGFTIGQKASWIMGPGLLPGPVVIGTNGLKIGSTIVCGGCQTVGLDASVA
jgi:hypothetical protein